MSKPKSGKQGGHGGILPRPPPNDAARLGGRLKLLETHSPNFGLKFLHGGHLKQISDPLQQSELLEHWLP